MRASTLFGLTIAILIGMAVVFGVKSAGLFDKKAPPTITSERPRILAARTNLFEGMATTSNDVMVRFVDASEMDLYEKNKHKYMQPYPEAAQLRILARNVGANEPLLKEHFQDQALPDSFGKLLGPNMRAVNLQMPRDRAAGGVLRKDDRVDVYLTSTLCSDPGCTRPETLTAPIAFGLRVVMKRDSIFPFLKADDENKPISFTLEANPYRAALIEFAKGRGYLTLFPAGGEQNGGKASLSGLNEKKEEERRDIQLARGQPIGDADLEEIFQVKAIPRAAPPPQPYQIEKVRGVHFAGVQWFPGDPSQGGGTGPAQGSDGRTRFGYSFTSPTAAPVTVPCATCPGGRRTISQ